MTEHVMPTYGRLPVTFERGEGARLWDSEGKEYLDALGGLAVCVLGHSHPKVAETIARQGATLIHTSNLYGIESQQTLAGKLAGLSGMTNMFFGNSGAEANEAAFKIARKYGHSKGIDAPETLVADGSFHGRTLAALSATGNPKVQNGFEPLVPGFTHVPFNDLDAMKMTIRDRPNVVAIMVEPIQGEGGIIVPDDDYLTGIRALCDEQGLLMILDEIQTGMGRTGDWFAWQHFDAAPDVMTLAKGLANGIPIGVCLARGPAADVLSPGTHGSTFGGNPFSCTVANTVLEVIEEEGLLEHAARMGERLRQNIESGIFAPERVVEIRGRGMMMGIEMDSPCTELVSMALERGLLVNVTAERVIRMLPPLNLSEAEVDQVAERLCDSIKALHNR